MWRWLPALVALCACAPVEREPIFVRSALDGAEVARLFALAAGELELESVEQDELGHTHTRYRQNYRGREVVGGEAIVHADALGQIYAVNGSARAGSAPLDPAVSSFEAEALAGGEPLRLVYLLDEASLRLVWEVRVERELPFVDLVYLDALTGEIADVHPQTKTLLDRKIYTANNTQTLPGTLRLSEGGTATDAVVTAAYTNTGKTYDFYKAVFARDSYDNKGATLVSSVHVGSRFNNAFWNGTQMGYGDGDGQLFGNFATSYDVTAHELTHAVTDVTASLVYRNEQGALNESMSDVLAAAAEAWPRQFAVDANTWKVGEDIFTPNTANDAMRYMDRPTADGDSRDYYPERYTGTQDNGGVHWNSGIGNLAFKLLTSGGTHPRNKTAVQVPAIGLEKTARIFYRGLTVYMTSSTNFLGARTATANAAKDLYDPGTSRAVEAAWAAVGVGPVPPPACVSTDGICDLNCNPFDTDCYCVQDMKCDPQCADLSKDPDCPKDCVANGVCAAEDCPRPDTDCVAVGQACGQQTQCKSRQCINDPEHPALYCSKPCAAAADCPEGMECGPAGACRYPQTPPVAAGEGCTPGSSRCAEGRVCTGPIGGQARCLMPCTDTTECGQRSVCETGQGDFRYCRELQKASAPPAAEQAEQVDEFTGGCSSGGGGNAGWIALAALLLSGLSLPARRVRGTTRR